MLLMRFAYGIRLPLPILCGASGVAAGKFLRYNIGTALGWALLFTGVGYTWGATATATFRRIQHYETWIIPSAVAIGLGVHLLTQRLGRQLA